MGLVGLARPVLWHSSRVSSHATGQFTDYQMWLMGTRLRNWYTADWDYGLTSIYFFCAATAAFTLINVLSLYRSTRTQMVSVADKFAGLFRYFSSRQYHVSTFGWYSPPLGVILIIAAMIVFFTALTFAVHPYYWPVPAMGNSPPLGTRTGWISIAIMPFMFAFSSKINLIGILTGVSHEKLQVFHRWTAWIMYITSLIHTFPFIRFNVWIGKMELYYETKSYYWTGVAALIPQTWLILMSWGPIRSRYYETFKKSVYSFFVHVSIIFMIFLFIHCNFRLSSWDYFWATGGVYGITWLARFIRTFFWNGLRHTATFEALPDRMVRVRIPAKNLKWGPGQHYFVRFLNLGAHALTSHPFTVTSLPSSGVLEFCMRVREGMTGRLVSFAGSGAASAVLLDGPYGGVHGSLGAYDRVVLLAGGSGASFTVPLLLDLLKGIAEKSVELKHVHFVWAFPRTESLECYKDLFSAALQGVPEGRVSVSLYVTDTSRPSSPSSDSGIKGEAETATETLIGRPNLGQIVRDAFAAGGTVGVASCGPDSFSLDVRNAVAECELQIARGGSSCTDIFLHSEAYRCVVLPASQRMTDSMPGTVGNDGSSALHLYHAFPLPVGLDPESNTLYNQPIG
ncbi:ferric reductase NAD binding domain-containing protein [Lyophyllum atratum]|nr:ferric reductase NAD binding domain-containing protein [Lyophyllum atratum]